MKLALLAGDGIGPEIMAEAKRVLDVFRKEGLKIETEEALVGGAARSGVSRRNLARDAARLPGADGDPRCPLRVHRAAPAPDHGIQRELSRRHSRASLAIPFLNKNA